MMKVLVLGGSRFIGLHIVRLLHSQGHQVSVLNRGQTQVGLPETVTRLYADRNDPSQVKATLKGTSYDAAFDLSGYTPAALKPVVETLDGSVSHYVFCSSASVYGTPFGRLNQAGVEMGLLEMASGIAPVSEKYPVNRGPDAGQYAENKILCEDLLMDAYAKRGFPFTSIRPPWVYGPDNYNKMQEGSFFARLTQGRKIIIPGDGLPLFQNIHVEDLADSFVGVLNHKETLGQVYNIAEAEATNANGYIQVIGEAMGVTPVVFHMGPAKYDALPNTLGLSEDPPIFPYRFSNGYYWYPLGTSTQSRFYTIAKAKRDFDWSPKYDIRSGMAMTYRWWLDRGLDKEVWDFSYEDEVLAM